MPGSDTAFNRIKSLLGKMDRSIDDARQQRLHADEDGGGAEISPESAVILSDTERQAVEETHEKPLPATARPPSKYGRARPIREIPNGSSGSSEETSNGFSGTGNRGTDTGWKTA